MYDFDDSEEEALSPSLIPETRLFSWETATKQDPDFSDINNNESSLGPWLLSKNSEVRSQNEPAEVCPELCNGTSTSNSQEHTHKKSKSVEAPAVPTKPSSVGPNCGGLAGVTVDPNDDFVTKATSAFHKNEATGSTLAANRSSTMKSCTAESHLRKKPLNHNVLTKRTLAPESSTGSQGDHEYGTRSKRSSGCNESQTKNQQDCNKLEDKKSGSLKGQKQDCHIQNTSSISEHEKRLHCQTARNEKLEICSGSNTQKEKGTDESSMYRRKHPLSPKLSSKYALAPKCSMSPAQNLGHEYGTRSKRLSGLAKGFHKSEQEEGKHSADQKMGEDTGQHSISTLPQEAWTLHKRNKTNPQQDFQDRRHTSTLTGRVPRPVTPQKQNSDTRAALAGASTGPRLGRQKRPPETPIHAAAEGRMSRLGTPQRQEKSRSDMNPAAVVEVLDSDTRAALAGASTGPRLGRQKRCPETPIHPAAEQKSRGDLNTAAVVEVLDNDTPAGSAGASTCPRLGHQRRRPETQVQPVEVIDAEAEFHSFVSERTRMEAAERQRQIEQDEALARSLQGRRDSYPSSPTQRGGGARGRSGRQSRRRDYFQRPMSVNIGLSFDGMENNDSEEEMGSEGWGTLIPQDLQPFLGTSETRPMEHNISGLARNARIHIPQYSMNRGAENSMDAHGQPGSFLVGAIGLSPAHGRRGTPVAQINLFSTNRPTRHGDLEDLLSLEAAFGASWSPRMSQRRGRGRGRGQREDFHIHPFLGRELNANDYELLSRLDEGFTPRQKGASNFVISQMPVSQVAPGQAAEECAICLDSLAEGQDEMRLLCFHAFHVPCIEKWLKNSKTCPICKVDVESLFEEAQKQSCSPVKKKK